MQRVEHPAIRLSLIDLGILTEIELIDNDVVVAFVFPFSHIPIADQLIHSIEKPINQLGLNLQYQIHTMSSEERQRFLQLEASAWKG